MRLARRGFDTDWVDRLGRLLHRPPMPLASWRPHHPVACPALAAALTAAGCDGCESQPQPPTTASAPTVSTAAPPPVVTTSEPVVVMPEPRCPPDMVKIKPRPTDAGPRRTYCIDRYEAMLVDQETGARISPYYAPSRKAAKMTARM